jgi:ADP-ribosylglycohydrolase
MHIEENHELPVTTASGSPTRVLNYDDYLDRIYGGWIGKAIGGTIGARFEGQKRWIEVERDSLFPDTIPPNDDLDLQVLWLHVLEQKGGNLTADDLAEAWLESCWYPFCEYGVFRRNWRLGIHPPDSGRFGNQLWETGMGCPIRSELWGYVFPGRPEVAARYAAMDASLDHGAESAGAEMLFSAMAADAFFNGNLAQLLEQHRHYLPRGGPIDRLIDVAFDCHARGLELRQARERVMLAGGVPEACDARVNVPITVLALLYGENDLEQTLMAALRCGYDTDCTMATAAAFIGQVLGASGLPAYFRDRIGDELVMGIDYERPESTLSALARDTARMGCLLSDDAATRIVQTPEMAPLRETAREPVLRVRVAYDGLPCVAPGETLGLTVHLDGQLPASGALTVEAPEGWDVAPRQVALQPGQSEVRLAARLRDEGGAWPYRNLFTLRIPEAELTHTFGIAGAAHWYLLGAHWHLDAPEDVPEPHQREWHHHFAAIDRDYLPEAGLEVAGLYRECSATLGRPALLVSRENEVPLDDLLGLHGPYVAYVARCIVSPRRQKAHVVVGHTDGFRLFLNGRLLGERDEHLWWTPQNTAYPVDLVEGRNLIVAKILKQDDPGWRFTLGFKTAEGSRSTMSQHFQDWLVDLSEGRIE